MLTDRNHLRPHKEESDSVMDSLQSWIKIDAKLPPPILANVLLILCMLS